MTANKDKVSDVKKDCGVDQKELELSETSMRTEQEISEAENEYYDKVWYVRHKASREPISDPQIYQDAEKAAKEVEAKYGNLDKWFPKDNYELEYLHGTLSALRWVLGDDWGNLDT